MKDVRAAVESVMGGTGDETIIDYIGTYRS